MDARRRHDRSGLPLAMAWLCPTRRRSTRLTAPERRLIRACRHSRGAGASEVEVDLEGDAVDVAGDVRGNSDTVVCEIAVADGVDVIVAEETCQLIEHGGRVVGNRVMRSPLAPNPPTVPGKEFDLVHAGEVAQHVACDERESPHVE